MSTFRQEGLCPSCGVENVRCINDQNGWTCVACSKITYCNRVTIELCEEKGDKFVFLDDELVFSTIYFDTKGRCSRSQNDFAGRFSDLARRIRRDLRHEAPVPREYLTRWFKRGRKVAP